MSLNIYEIAFTILNTIIVFLFLKHFFFGKVGVFMQKRSDAIALKIKDADENYAKADKLGREYEMKIASAEAEGRKIVEEYKSKADSIYLSITGEAKNEADLIRERAKIDVQRERDKARDEIKAQVVVLSLLAASKAIGEQLDEDRHHKLIQEFINKAGV
jgi:F-type H+-transporting ATPase subunit b